MSLEQLRHLPEKDTEDKRLRSARLFFWKVVGTWMCAGLVLAAAAISLLVSHTAYSSAFLHHTGEQRTAELMWNTYCTKPWHEVSADECEKQLRRPLDCKWANVTRLIDVAEQSLVDSNIRLLSPFQLMQPRMVISLMVSLYALSLVAPFVAAWYYFREKRRQAELLQTTFNESLTKAERASLHHILGQAHLSDQQFTAEKKRKLAFRQNAYVTNAIRSSFG